MTLERAVPPAPTAAPLVRGSADCWPATKRWALRLTGGVAVGLAAMHALPAGRPTWSSPHPAAADFVGIVFGTWMDALFGAPFHRAHRELFDIALPAAVAFVFWTFLIVRDRRRIPWLSYLPAVLTAFVTIVVLAYGWRWYPDVATAVFLASVNVAAIAALLCLALRNRQAPSHWRNYTFHLVLFLWAAWYAAPLYLDFVD